MTEIKKTVVNGESVVQISDNTTVVCGDCGQKIKYIDFYDWEKHKPSCDLLI